ncbi:MAG: acyltransferase family protein [Clostridia bacterium]|nr:acyltransferase family protein [Clostridia bacterium]
METLQAKRKDYLDIARGIGILLVVLGHCPLVYNPLKQWIYSFHMPLFFIISGMVWDRASHEKKGYFSGRFIADKVKRLIIPCFIWGIFYLLLDAILDHSFSIKRIIYLLYGSQAGFQRSGSLSSLWFMTCMFLSVCAFELLQRCFAKAKHRLPALLCVSAAFAAAGLFLPRIAVGYPWCADVAFLAAAFMIWGHAAANLLERQNDRKAYFVILPLIPALAASLTFVFNLPHIAINNADLAGRYFGSPPLYLLNAAAGSAFVLLFSVLLGKIRIITTVFSYLGRRTIPIFIIHKPIVRALKHIGERFAIPALITVTVSAAAAIVLSLLIYQIIKRILPIAFGESRKAG